MLSRLRFVLLLPVATLIACGGSSNSSSGGTNFTPAAGDYVITVGSGTASQSTFTGNLAVSGSSVSGVFRYYNPGTVCVSPSQDILFSGSFANGVITLTSTSFSNSVATLTINLPFSNNNIGQQLASGTSVITGGTCALASSTLQAQLIPAFTGSWTVTLTNPTNETATLIVQQSSTATTDGQFPATGTISCIANAGTLTPLTGLVSGPNLALATTLQGSAVVTANYTSVPASIAACGGTGTMTSQ